MQTWQILDGASKWAFQMDGVITRTSMSEALFIDMDDFLLFFTC